MNNYKAFPDDKLIDLLKESDHKAYTEIYNRYFYLVYSHAYKKLRNEGQAEDVVQDLFASLWFKREFNLPNSNLAGYLFTAVRNRIFDMFAHDKVRSKYIGSLQGYLEAHSNVATDHRIRENDLKTYIEQQILSLPPKMRRIFEMSRKEYLSYKEIAERTNTSENNISKQVNNALRILKTKLGVVAYLYLLYKLKP